VEVLFRFTLSLKGVIIGSMPRNYYFQIMNPDIAEEYHKEYAAFFPNVYKGIKNLFRFTANWKKEK
jgi:hypothetical protein